MNFFFLYGCSPSHGVLAKTQMVKDIYNIFIKNADRINAAIYLPQTFDFLQGSDASFETA